jgi:hypothetical protein
LLHVNATEMGASLSLAVPKLGDLGTLNDDQLDTTADGVDDTLDACAPPSAGCSGAPRT